jgi:hypothetical protein
MKKRSSDGRTFCTQLQQLGRRIRVLRACLSRDHGTHFDQAKLELQLIGYVDLQRKLDRPRAAPEQQRQLFNSALQADIDGLARSLEAWLARQDRRLVSSWLTVGEHHPRPSSGGPSRLE